MTILQKPPWTKAEVETLRAMLGRPKAELMQALPRRTWTAILDKAQMGDIRRRGRRTNWLKICAAHKPRIILATPFPQERIAS